MNNIYISLEKDVFTIGRIKQQYTSIETSKLV